jgi:hypothetical protein
MMLPEALEGALEGALDGRALSRLAMFRANECLTINLDFVP